MYKETEIGLIPEDWDIKAVEDVALINESSIKKDFKLELIEYIDIASVDKGMINDKQLIKLDEAPTRARRVVKDNDILISTVRPNLKHYTFINSAKSNTIASTGFAVISALNINPKFLYYYLTTDKYTEYLTAIADSHTSAYPSFNPDIIEKSFVPFPSMDEQNSIAKVLSDLDQKIEVNHQMNQNLEKIGQTIFRHWFVHFEFPDENGQPYKSSSGEMVDSELGEIPVGWKVGTLDEISENFDSKRVPLSNKERESRKGKYPYYGAASIMDYIDDYLFDGIYILLSEDGSNVVDAEGKPLLQYVWGKFWVNNHAHILKGKKGFPEEYIYLLLKNSNMNHLVTGAAQPKINQKNMNSLKIIIPDLKTLELFSNILNPIFAKYRISSEENNILSPLRDSLLPKLMSGKIRLNVPEEAIAK